MSTSDDRHDDVRPGFPGLEEHLLPPPDQSEYTPERRFQEELALAFAYFLLCVITLTSITEWTFGTRSLGVFYLVSLAPVVALLIWIRRGGAPAKAGIGLVSVIFLIVAFTNIATGGQSIGANIALPMVTLVAVMFSPPRLAWAWLGLVFTQILFAAWMRESGIIFPVRPDPDWVRSAADRVPLFFSIGAALIGWMVMRALARFRTEFVTSRVAEADAKARADASADRFSDFAEVAAEGFWETDLDLQLTYVSQSLAAAVGLEADAMLGLTPGEAYLHRIPDAEGVARFMEPMFRRRVFDDLLFPAVDREGNTRYLRCLGRPVFSPSGDFQGFRGVVRDVTEQLKNEQEIESRERQLRLITESIPAMVSYLDGDVRFQYCNELASEVFGMAREAVIGRTLYEVLDDATCARLQGHVTKVLGGELVRFEDEGFWQGRHHHFQTTYVPDRGDDEALRGFFAVTFDITELKKTALDLHETSDRLKLITDSIPAHIFQLDSDRRFTFSNRMYRDIGTASMDDPIGSYLSEHYGKDGCTSLELSLDRAYSGETVTTEIELDGKTLRATFVPDANGERHTRGIYGLVSDVTELKNIENELRRLTLFDPLTGIGNRRRFQERLDDAMARRKRSGSSVALMFLDLDRFKQVNDSLGHEAGDLLLKAFAQRLCASVRKTDTVCRLSGDEFVVILEVLEGKADAEAVARKINQAMTERLDILGSSITVSATIGIAFAETGDECGEDLLRRADRALYRAKSRERGSFEFG